MPKRPNRPEPPAKGRKKNVDSGEFLTDDEDSSFVTGDFFKEDLEGSASGVSSTGTPSTNSEKRPNLRVVEGGAAKAKASERLPSTIHVDSEIYDDPSALMTEPGVPEAATEQGEAPERDLSRMDGGATELAEAEERDLSRMDGGSKPGVSRTTMQPSPFDAFPPVSEDEEPGDEKATAGLPPRTPSGSMVVGTDDLIVDRDSRGHAKGVRSARDRPADPFEPEPEPPSKKRRAGPASGEPRRVPKRELEEYESTNAAPPPPIARPRGRDVPAPVRAADAAKRKAREREPEWREPPRPRRRIDLPEVEEADGRESSLAGADLGPPEDAPISDVARKPLVEPTVAKASRPIRREPRLPAESPTRPKGVSAALERPAGRLVVDDGPHKGQVFLLYPGTHVLGRGKGVDLLLADDAVSRRHFEVTVENGEVSLKDLGSGNGTRVNKQRVADALLSHGDKIQIGRCTLRFEAQGAAQLRARQADGEEDDAPAESGFWAALPPERRRLFTILGAVVGALLLVIIVAKIVANQREAERVAQRQEHTAKVDAAIREKARAGEEAMHAKRYDEARRLFEEARDLAAGLDEDTTSYERLLASAVKEAANQRSVQDGLTLAHAGKFAEARARIGTVKPESDAFAQASAALDEVTRLEVAALQQRAADAKGRGDYADAKAALERVQELMPGDAATRQDLDDVNRKLAAQPAPAPEENRHAEKSGKKGGRREAHEGGGRASLAPVVRAFDDGDADSAYSAAQRASRSGDRATRNKAARLLKAIGAFRGSWRAGKDDLAAHDPNAWVKLDRAYRAAREVSPNGETTRSVRVELARAHYLAANAAYQNRAIKSARQHYALVVQLAPEDQSGAYSRKQLRDLDAYAQRRYDEAYGISDPGERASKMREVMEAADPGSDLYRKAASAAASAAAAE